MYTNSHSHIHTHIHARIKYTKYISYRIHILYLLFSDDGDASTASTASTNACCDTQHIQLLDIAPSEWFILNIFLFVFFILLYVVCVLVWLPLVSVHPILYINIQRFESGVCFVDIIKNCVLALFFNSLQTDSHVCMSFFFLILNGLISAANTQTKTTANKKKTNAHAHTRVYMQKIFNVLFNSIKERRQFRRG